MCNHLWTHQDTTIEAMQLPSNTSRPNICSRLSQHVFISVCCLHLSLLSAFHMCIACISFKLSHLAFIISPFSTQSFGACDPCGEGLRSIVYALFKHVPCRLLILDRFFAVVHVKQRLLSQYFNSKSKDEVSSRTALPHGMAQANSIVCQGCVDIPRIQSMRSVMVIVRTIYPVYLSCRQCLQAARLPCKRRCRP